MYSERKKNTVGGETAYMCSRVVNKWDKIRRRT